MVGDATARIDQALPVVPPTQNVAAAPQDRLAEVAWVEADPVAPTPAPIPAQPVQAAPLSQPAALSQPEALAQPVTPGRVAAPVALAGRTMSDQQDRTPTTEVEALRWRDLDGQPTPADSQTLRHPGSSTAAQPRGFVREWAPVAIAALIVAALLRTFVVQAFEIPSGSMLPTLRTDDRIVVNQLSYAFGDISRGEVVVFERPPTMPAGPNDAEYLVKRVIGLPGDEIQLFEGNVWINGERLVEDDYLFELESTRPTNVTIPGCDGGGAADSCTVPADFIFVLGDNRTDSTDSRVAGPISADLVVGRAVVRAWPLNALSWL